MRILNILSGVAVLFTTLPTHICCTTSGHAARRGACPRVASPYQEARLAMIGKARCDLLEFPADSARHCACAFQNGYLARRRIPCPLQSFERFLQ
jgi:hypothetical protein